VLQCVLHIGRLAALTAGVAQILRSAKTKWNENCCSVSAMGVRTNAMSVRTQQQNICAPCRPLPLEKHTSGDLPPSHVGLPKSCKV
jgi:hypothetical protein